MSLGECTANDLFISTLTSRGFSAIATLHELETLIITKICVLDNDSLLAITQNCRLFKHLVIDMLSESNVTDLTISSISRNYKSIETLEISNNRNISRNIICEN